MAKKKDRGLTPRFLSNASTTRSGQATVWLLGGLLGVAFLILFLEDIRFLRNATWPKGWPTLVSPLATARLFVAGLAFTALLTGLGWSVRRKGSWLLLPGVGLFRTRLSLAPSEFRPSELELARTSPDAFWVVRRGEPVWLRPMIVPFRTDAEKEIFERWLSERPFDYADMLGPFSLVESAEDTPATAKEAADMPGPFSLIDSGEETPPTAKEAEQPAPAEAVVESEAADAAPTSGEPPEHETQPTPPSEPATVAPEPPTTAEYQVARWRRWTAHACLCLGLAIALGSVAEYRYGSSPNAGVVDSPGVQKFVSNTWRFSAGAALCLFVGLAGLSFPTRVLRVGNLLVLGGRVYTAGPETHCTVSPHLLKITGQAWEVGFGAQSKRRSFAPLGSREPVEAALRDLGCTVKRGGPPILRVLVGVVGALGVASFAFLVSRDLPFLRVIEFSDSRNQQAFLVTRRSDAQIRGLVLTSAPIKKPGPGANFWHKLKPQRPSWTDLFSGSAPPLELTSTWPTQDELRRDVQVSGGATLTRGVDVVSEGPIRLDDTLLEEFLELRSGDWVPQLLDGRILEGTPALIRDYRTGLASHREYRGHDQNLVLRWHFGHGEIEWVDIQPRRKSLPHRSAGTPRWVSQNPAWYGKARRLSPRQTHSTAKLPPPLRLLEATREINEDEVSVRAALEPLFPDLWRSGSPSRPSAGGGGSGPR